jgi:ERI1 exoribonuclease 3
MFYQTQNHYQSWQYPPPATTSSSPLYSTQQHEFEYLIVLDFEATCDNAVPPKVTSDTQEVIEFPFIVVQLNSEESNNENNEREPQEQPWSTCSSLSLPIQTRKFPHMKILDQRQYFVKPEWSTELTEFCTQLTGLTNEIIFTQGKPLRQVIKLFDDYLEENFYSKSRKFALVTDGQWDLKQLLLRETKKKKIPLASHYRTFFDLRAEFQKCFPYVHIRGLRSMVQYANIEFTGRHHSGISDCMTICELVSFLLNQGHCFANPITIDEHYDPFRDPSFQDFNVTRNNGIVFNADSSTCYLASYEHPKKNINAQPYYRGRNANNITPNFPMYANGLFIPQEHYNPNYTQQYRQEIEDNRQQTYYYHSSPETDKSRKNTPEKNVALNTYYTYPKKSKQRNKRQSTNHQKMKNRCDNSRLYTKNKSNTDKNSTSSNQSIANKYAGEYNANPEQSENVLQQQSEANFSAASTSLTLASKVVDLSEKDLLVASPSPTKAFYGNIF